MAKVCALLSALLDIIIIIRMTSKTETNFETKILPLLVAADGKIISVKVR